MDNRSITMLLSGWVDYACSSLLVSCAENRINTGWQSRCHGISRVDVLYPSFRYIWLWLHFLQRKSRGRSVI